MKFMEDVVVYDKKGTKVYINQCYAPKGRKTKVFAVRRDDSKCLASYLGSIEWSGAWKQYVFVPEEDTVWSRSCLTGIAEFLTHINVEHNWKVRLCKLKHSGK